MQPELACLAPPHCYQLAAWLEIGSGELEWFADLRGLGIKERAARLQHYSYRVLQKDNAGVRLIEAPNNRLKAFQRWILNGILEQIPVHDAAHGFRKGRSIQTFCTPHADQRAILKMDLEDFFPSISGARIQGLFRTAGYPEAVADLLGSLCTNTTPRSICTPLLGARRKCIAVRTCRRARLLRPCRRIWPAVLKALSGTMTSMNRSILAALLLAGSLRAQTTPPKALLVLSKGDHTLSIVDPVSLQVIASMPSGPDPHEVIPSSDGRTAYISNYGGGAYNTLTVVDLINHKTTGAIDLGALRGPHGLDYAGGKVYFTAEAAKVIGTFDPATQKVDWVLGTGQDRTHMVWVSRDMKTVITSNVSSATMTMIAKVTRMPMGPPPGGPRGPGNGPPPNGGRAPGGPPQGGPPPGPRTDWEETVIPVGHGAEGFDVSRDEKELWAANAQDGTISIIDLSAKKVVATLAADVRSANRLKFTPDGKHVLVSMLGAPELVIFDVASRTTLKRLKIGTGAAGIQMAPDGTVAYVACTPDSYVAIVDLASLEVIGHINAGKEPDGLAWVVRP